MMATMYCLPSTFTKSQLFLRAYALMISNVVGDNLLFARHVAKSVSDVFICVCANADVAYVVMVVSCPTRKFGLRRALTSALGVATRSYGSTAAPVQSGRR